MCPGVLAIRDKNSGATMFTINQCGSGTKCTLAHSAEEIQYHPSMYKKNACKSLMQGHGCGMGDMCPNLHPLDLQKLMKRVGDDIITSHQRHPVGRRQSPGTLSTSTGDQFRGMASVHPSGAPMVYVAPAPSSSFEKQLQMPGLRNLFRRNCAILRAHVTAPAMFCAYNNFGDDWGIAFGRMDVRSGTMPRQGLPSPSLFFKGQLDVRHGFNYVWYMLGPTRRTFGNKSLMIFLLTK